MSLAKEKHIIFDFVIGNSSIIDLKYWVLYYFSSKSMAMYFITELHNNIDDFSDTLSCHRLKSVVTSSSLPSALRWPLLTVPISDSTLEDSYYSLLNQQSKHWWPRKVYWSRSHSLSRWCHLFLVWAWSNRHWKVWANFLSAQFYRFHSGLCSPSLSLQDSLSSICRYDS